MYDCYEKNHELGIRRPGLNYGSDIYYFCDLKQINLSLICFFNLQNGNKISMAYGHSEDQMRYMEGTQKHIAYPGTL